MINKTKTEKELLEDAIKYVKYARDSLTEFQKFFRNKYGFDYSSEYSLDALVEAIEYGKGIDYKKYKLIVKEFLSQQK